MKSYVGAAGALLAAAGALWLSGGGAGHAASAPQAQGVTVAVTGKTISWLPRAQCDPLSVNRDPALTADFGSSPPGGGELFLAVGATEGLDGGPSDIFRACLESNATWDLNVAATSLTNGTGGVISPANLALTGRTEHTKAIESPCAGLDVLAGANSWCAIGVNRSLVNDAEPTGLSAATLLYGYRLTVPGTAPGGSYTGTVTFTAAN